MPVSDIPQFTEYTKVEHTGSQPVCSVFLKKSPRLKKIISGNCVFRNQKILGYVAQMAWTYIGRDKKVE